MRSMDVHVTCNLILPPEPFNVSALLLLCKEKTHGSPAEHEPECCAHYYMIVEGALSQNLTGILGNHIAFEKFNRASNNFLNFQPGISFRVYT